MQVFGGQPNTMLANRKESYKSLQLTFPFNHIQHHSRYLAHISPETAQISIRFRLSGTFAMMVLNRRNGRFSAVLLYLFRLSCIFERTSEQQPTFRIAKRKSREKKCRTEIEQSEHHANRIIPIVKGIDDFVRLFAGFLRIEHILKIGAILSSLCI